MTALVIVSGLPGTGKSTIAEHAASAIGASLLSKDVFEAALWRGGIGPELNTGWASYEQIGAVAESQLRLHRSVVVDAVVPTERIRASWRALADRHRARFLVIECICSDERAHRTRLEARVRGIDGWPELTWEQVAEVRSRYDAWNEPRLVLDALRPIDRNRAEVTAYLGGQVAAGSSTST